MNRPTRTAVIVGGGTAGWLTASVVAAERRRNGAETPLVVLVESPDVPAIGVGEGTWPSMRMTLQRIGLPEGELIAGAEASFKQGTRFFGWGQDDGADDYCHPFSWPAEYASLNPARHWLAQGGATPFAAAVTPQASVIGRGLAPKQASTPDYAFTVNYGYHLDAAKFAERLRRHAVEQLGVTHLHGTVDGLECHADGDLAALVLRGGQRVAGELFVDCTGQRALLIGEHCGSRFVSAAPWLFNDRAIAVQVPYANVDAPIASATCATAQATGWIWDIGLAGRRGLGFVHSQAHIGEDAALSALKAHIARTTQGIDLDALSYRTIPFRPGYREAPWTRNCVAVGLSAGFVEPLEASALALIEQAAAIIGQQFPRDREIMAVVAKRFNAKMRRHWQRIIEFLKLHYVLSSRDGAYWQDHRAAETCPEGLAEKLVLWRQQPPWHDDAPMLDELFPSASYQYVLYGLGFRPRYPVAGQCGPSRQRAEATFAKTQADANKLMRGLPTNRQLLRAFRQRAA